MKQGGYMIKVYAISDGEGIDGQTPVYVITDGKLFRTVNHLLGWSEVPDYEMRSDGRLYRTEYHRQGKGSLPDYEFRKDQMIYRTNYHPDGRMDQPVFVVYD
jgi:hypothetical protein